MQELSSANQLVVSSYGESGTPIWASAVTGNRYHRHVGCTESHALLYFFAFLSVHIRAFPVYLWGPLQFEQRYRVLRPSALYFSLC
jgi:hypothetical protein